MRKDLLCYMAVLTVLISLPVYAGHDHGGGGGSHDSSGHVSASTLAREQASRADQMLKECSQHLESIQRQIGRLKAQLPDGKAATSAINDELERIEQHLREAKDIARALRVF